MAVAGWFKGKMTVLEGMGHAEEEAEKALRWVPTASGLLDSLFNSTLS